MGVFLHGALAVIGALGENEVVVREVFERVTRMKGAWSPVPQLWEEIQSKLVDGERGRGSVCGRHYTYVHTNVHTYVHTHTHTHTHLCVTVTLFLLQPISWQLPWRPLKTQKAGFQEWMAFSLLLTPRRRERGRSGGRRR